MKWLEITKAESNSTSRYISKGNENKILKIYLYSHVYCSIIHKSSYESNLCIYQQMNGSRRCTHVHTTHTHTHTHTHTGILFTHSHVKGGNPAICENMDRSWGHYAKRDISDRERQILHISYTWNLKKPNSQKQDNGDYQGLGWGKLGRCCLRVQTCN